MKDWPPFQHVKWNPDAKELRSFAISMVIGFGVLGLVAALRHRGVVPLSIGLWTAGVVLALGALIPGLGRLVYLAVYIPTSLIGFVVSNVLLTLVFFGVFLPIGLLLKVLGKDLLHLRLDPSRSEWHPHTPPRDAKQYYRRY